MHPLEGMMTNRLGMLINRVKEIYREEGLLATIGRILAFVVSPIIDEYSVLYVYEHTLTEGNEADYLPKTQNITHRIIETVDQLDDLSNEGHDLSLLDIDQAHYRLEKGAIASLLFTDREFASVSWSAFTKEAKNTFNPHPYKVDFANNEVSGGGTWVNPKYRGQGLNYYTLYKKEQDLLNRGVTKHRSIVLSSNSASQKVKDRMGNKLVAKAHYIRIFGLQFWRERPIKPNDSNNTLSD